MRKIIAIALFIALIPSCARLQTAYSVLTQTTISPEQVTLAVDGFRALEITATNYLRLRRCNGANGPVCRDPAASREISRDVRTGRIARDNLKNFLREHPGELGTQGLYDALKNATDTLKKAIDTYRAG